MVHLTSHIKARVLTVKHPIQHAIVPIRPAYGCRVDVQGRKVVISRTWNTSEIHRMSKQPCSRFWLAIVMILRTYLPPLTLSHNHSSASILHAIMDMSSNPVTLLSSPPQYGWKEDVQVIPIPLRFSRSVNVLMMRVCRLCVDVLTRSFSVNRLSLRRFDALQELFSDR